MGFQAPNERLGGGMNRGSSNAPRPPDPAAGDGTGRNHAHPGRVAPPNGDTFSGRGPQGNAGLSGMPTSTIGDGRVQQGSVPVQPGVPSQQVTGPWTRRDDAPMPASSMRPPRGR